MPVDFSGLVLGPAIRIFGRPITVTPAVSQPGAPAYGASGIFRAQPIDVVMEDGQTVTSTKYTIGIRRSLFLIQVRRGDILTLDDGRDFTIDRYHPDGQGGAELTVLLNSNEPATP